MTISLKKPVLLLLLLVVFSGISQAQQNELYQKQWLIQDGDTMPYRILFPDSYDPAKKYPVIYFLHGRGESGSDNEKQLIHGSSMFLRDSLRKKYPAIVVFPQCPSDNYWSNVVAVSEGNKYGRRSFYFTPGGEPTRPMKRVMALVENINMRFKIDPDRVYVMGLSMGGMGTFELVRRMPGVFAAAIPICGGAHPQTAAALKKTSWWIFHGLKDDVVDPKFSKDMHAALKNVNADVKITLYPNANHNSWDSAFQENLFGWMFSKKRASSSKTYDLNAMLKENKLQIFNRQVTPLEDKSKKIRGVGFSDMGIDGIAFLNDVEFSNGTIDVDLRGNDQLQRSFIGIAFHAEDDKRLDAIYFRPFNFNSSDSVRRIHAVQYISHPEYDWKRLREEQNGKYEKAINLKVDPNDWFHARIEVDYPMVRVYINNSTVPSLEVQKISTKHSGKIGLWTGFNSGGDFANLKITRRD